MLKATWRTIMAHKMRMALTVVSVTLGVALVAGTLIFTDTLQKTFDDLFADTTSDVQITRTTAFDPSRAGDPGALPLVPASAVQIVADVPGVQAAEGTVQVDGAQVVGKDGKLLANQGAPSFGVNWSDSEVSILHLTEGRGPEGASEVALDTQTFAKSEFQVGDTIQVLTPRGAATELKLVGVFRFGASGNLAGASLAIFDTATAQSLLLAEPDAFTGIGVAIDQGATQQEVAAAIQQALGSDYKVQTAAEAADDAAAVINDTISGLSLFFLVFAGIALVVGSFIIYNTFAMLIAQRRRELGLLRAIGANRRQVFTSVVSEALVVGILGSTLGLVVGLGLAWAISALFVALGFLDAPATSLVLAPGTVVASYLIGIGVTALSSIFPAWAAARIRPIAAMGPELGLQARSLRWRTVLGIAFVALGLVLGFSSFRSSGGDAAKLVGLAALVMLIGVVIVSAPLVRPLVWLLAAPARWLAPVTGRLASGNAVSNPRRTARTALALTIMLTVVTGIGVLAASATASVDKLVDEVVAADYTITNPGFLPFSPEVAETLRQLDGVASVTSIRFVDAQVDGDQLLLTGIDAATAGDALNLPFVSGGLSDLLQDAVVVDDQLAADRGWNVGDTLPITFIDDSVQTFRIAGIYEVSAFLNGLVLPTSAIAEVPGGDRDTMVYVNRAPDADPVQVRAEIDAAMAAYPNVEVQDGDEFKESFRANFNQLLFLIWALLAVTAVIATLGIINTLLLSVLERTREIGLMRAIGATRRQLKRSIVIESVVISVFGAVLGVVLGLVLGWWLQHSVSGSGIEVLQFPVGQIVTAFIIAILVGLVASLWPARRASKLRILEAIAAE